LSEEDEETALVEAMPNPFDEAVRIRWNGSERASYELYGIDGTLMRSGTLKGGKGRIRGEELPAGVYILNLRDAKSGEAIDRKRIVRKP
jgi:hypothetical protein